MDGISDERQGESGRSPLFDENKGGEKVIGICMSMLSGIKGYMHEYAICVM